MILGGALIALLAFFARGDVPFGQVLWLQGIDGNPPTAGFEIDGNLRLEAIDEPLDVGLNINSGIVTNGVTGVFDVAPGPGGARYVIGPVINRGEMDVRSVNLSWYVNGTCENHGTINLTGYAGFGFYGPSTMLDLEEGALVQGSDNNSYVWVQDGEFLFRGGTITGRVFLASASASVADLVTNSFVLNLIGPRCQYDGLITAGRTLHLTYDGRFDPLSLTLTRATQLEGALQIDSQPSGAPMVLTLTTGRLLVSPGGTISTGAGGLGATVFGNLTNSGTINQQGPLQFVNDRPLVNSGTWNLGAGAVLTTSTPLLQAGGALTLSGGSLNAVNGLSVAAGTFAGNGAIAGSVTNHALVSLTRNRSLSVAGDWNQDTQGILEIQASAADPAADQAALRVSGRLSLAGQMKLTTNGPVSWTPGISVGVVAATNLASWFTDVQLPVLPLGLHWTLPATTNDFRFVVTTNSPALQLLARTSSTNRFLEVFGGIGTALVVEESSSLGNWRTFTNLTRFEGLARFELPAGEQSVQLFRATFTPAVP